MHPAKNAAGTLLTRLTAVVRRTGLAGQIAGTCAAAFLAVIAVISLAGHGASTAAQASSPVAPAFSLAELGHAGQKVSLSAYAGRPVIVNFFASWCGPCQKETPELARFYDQSGGQAQIIGVDSNDHTAAALRFVRDSGVRYPVGVDPLGALASTTFEVQALPQTFFLNAQHRIVKRIYGAVTAAQLRQGVALMNGHPGGQLTARQDPG